MLLFKRNVGEKLKIGKDVTVTVLGFKGNQISIGIDAPRDIQVNREECWPSDPVDIQINYLKACA